MNIVEEISEETDIDKRGEETIREYINRVSDRGDVSDDTTQQLIKTVEKSMFSPNESFDNSVLERFLSEVDLENLQYRYFPTGVISAIESPS